MNIVFVNADFSGCGWYRCIMPAEVINNRKLANAIATNVITDEVMEWGDIFVWQRQHNDKIFDIVSKFRHKKHIAEFDDNLLQIPTTNPAYKQVTDEVKKNFIKMVKLCDAVTVSTQPLKEVFSRYHQNISVLPNSIPINYLNVPDIQKFNEDKEEVRIGWCGSAFHHDDLRYILHPLYEVASKYNQVKLVFMGWLPDYLKDHLPPERLEYHNWVEFKDYYDKLKSLNLDIALAPLDYNEFNRSKSNLKFLDYTTVGVPVIASDVCPYATTIENGFDGIIVKKNRHSEWLKAISELVENKVRRLEFTLNAQEKLVRDYDIYKNIDMWVDVYKGLFSNPEKEKEGMDIDVEIIGSLSQSQVVKDKSPYSFSSGFDFLQIHNHTQTELFLQSVNGPVEVSFVRFEQARHQGQIDLFADMTLYDKESDKVFIILGIKLISEDNIFRRVVFPTILKRWPDDLLLRLAETLLVEARRGVKQYEIRQLCQDTKALPCSLDLTLERAIPGLIYYITAIHHLKRYHFAKSIAKEGSILDCASGSGYGSNIILQNKGVSRYQGVDLDQPATTFAKKIVSDPRADFYAGPLESLPKTGYDWVISFETIEHTLDPEHFLRTLISHMSAGGKLILSLPSEKWGGSHLNPYHITNWTFQRFRRLLERYFSSVEYYFQRLSLLDTETFQASEISKQQDCNQHEDEVFIACLSNPKDIDTKFGNRIVVKRTHALGDAILATPVVRALKNKFPASTLVAVTKHTEVFVNNPYADIVAQPSFTPTDDDIIIDLDNQYEMRPNLHIIEAYSIAARTELFDARAELFLDRWNYLPIAKEIKARNWHDKVKKVVAIHMAATSPDRVWPSHYWIELIKSILSDETTGVVVVGAKNDWQINQVHHGHLIQLVGKTTLRETAAAIAMSDIMVAPDSGMIHVAAAVGTRGVGLFGMADPDKRLPLNGSMVGIQADIECKGCLHLQPPPVTSPRCIKGNAVCYEMIRPERVLRTVQPVLAEVQPGAWLAKLSLTFQDDNTLSLRIPRTKNV